MNPTRDQVGEVQVQVQPEQGTEKATQLKYQVHVRTQVPVGYETSTGTGITTRKLS